VIILESIILAAGYCSRFNFDDNSYKKYMLPLERSNILNYIIIAMHKAGVKKINIIVDQIADTSYLSKLFRKFVEKLDITPPELNFIKNLHPERENGYSLFMGLNHIKSKKFILSMADHVFSDNIYSLILQNYKNEDILLATDPMEINGIYDLDDCTKVYGQDSVIKKIGKNISEYNRLDMGVFIMKSDSIRKISQNIENKTQKFGVSDVVISSMKSNLKVSFLDFPSTTWLDIDTDTEYRKLNKVFYKSSKFRPFDLNIFDNLKD
jgi:CDP-L-myo-inositol myo-inositolphosphotransferase